MRKNKKRLNRRDFMKFIGSSSIAGSLGQLAYIKQANANAPAFSDYKAIVCIFLNGGNDSLNMFVPTSSAENIGYEEYASTRNNLAVQNNDLNLSTVSSTNTDLNNGIFTTGSGNPYNVNHNHQTAYTHGVYDLSDKGIELGVNGVMPELAQLITDNKATIIANAGNLVNPVTRSEILNAAPTLPLFLFAHDHQRRELQTGQADNLNDIGWAGKIADSWTGINSNSSLALNISYSGNERMLIGNNKTPLVMRPGTPPRFTDMVIGEDDEQTDRRALFRAFAGMQNTSSTGNLDFNGNNTFVTSDPFKNLYNTVLNSTMDTFDVLYSTWIENEINYISTGSYGEDLFESPSSSDLGFASGISGRLIEQLESVAKLIHLGATGILSNNAAYNRQIFYVSLGGFDNHSGQLSIHPLLLREISLALWKFQKALEELGHENKVTTFTMSDFGRSVSNNGDGTDHAWGAFHIVMGGDGKGSAGNLNGGKMIGDLPDIRQGGDDDYSDKGRIIPKIAQDQINATICDWFGVDETTISSIFPNLSNFETESGVASSSFLNELFVSDPVQEIV